MSDPRQSIRSETHSNPFAGAAAEADVAGATQTGHAGVAQTAMSHTDVTGGRSAANGTTATGAQPFIGMYDESARERLAHDAVLEQMAHGATYEGQNDGESVSHGAGIVDRTAMLGHAGYAREPRLINGADGMQMVVFDPAPGSGARPVVSFRGTSSLRDARADADRQGVGADQYRDNAALIQRVMHDEAQRYHQGVEVTGHSLGGSLAQMAAARDPSDVAHITTFQSPGISQADAHNLQAYNQGRVAQGLPPIDATHYRVNGDLVPSAGERWAPGTVHEMEVTPTPAPASPTVPVGGPLLDPVQRLVSSARGHVDAHLAFPVSGAALQTREGQDALRSTPGHGPLPSTAARESGQHDASRDTGSLEAARRRVLPVALAAVDGLATIAAGPSSSVADLTARDEESRNAPNGPTDSAEGARVRAERERLRAQRAQERVAQQAANDRARADREAQLDHATNTPAPMRGAAAIEPRSVARQREVRRLATQWALSRGDLAPSVEDMMSAESQIPE